MLDFIARFKREAIAVSRVGQENIVDVTDFGRTDDGRFFFVMELVDGLTLAQQLRKDGPFTPARMLRVAVQVARCLMAAHAAGVVHRDLKPENVMLVQRASSLDFVKVLDFGIAKVEASGTTRFGGQTAVGMVVGTPQYMPPEQARGLAIDGRTDVYTLGLIMHELLTGRPCFRGDSPAALLLMQLSSEPPPLALPGMPAGLEALIMQMLQKKADDRPASMAEVLSRLEPLLLRVDPQRRRTESNPELDPAAVAATVQVEGVHQPHEAPTALVPVEAAVVTAVAQLKHRVQRRPSPRQPVPPQTQVPAVQPVPADDEPLPTLQRSRAPLVIGVLAAFGLLVGVVALMVGSPAAGIASVPAPSPASPGLAAARPTDPPPAATTPPTTPPPVRPSVRLSITSTPPGAEVYAADVLLGTTPLTLQRPVDTVVELRFELSGYENLSRKVGFSTDRTLDIALEAVKRASPPPRVTPPPARAKAQDLKEAPF